MAIAITGVCVVHQGEKRQTYETDNSIARAEQSANRKDRSVKGAANRWTLRRDSLRPVHAGATRSLSHIDRGRRARAGRRAPKRPAEDLDEQPEGFKSVGSAHLVFTPWALFSESARTRTCSLYPRQQMAH